MNVPEEKTRVDFNAPTSLVERADSVIEILDISRTRLLIDALEDDLPRDEAFYDGEISEWTGSNSSESDDESHA